MPDIQTEKNVLDRLIAFRKRATGLSQDKIAARLGMQRSNYAQLERGKQKLSFKTAKKIAEAFPDKNLSPEWLLEGRGEAPIFNKEPMNIMHISATRAARTNPGNPNPKPVYAVMSKDISKGFVEAEKLLGQIDLCEFNFENIALYLKVKDTSMQGDLSNEGGYPKNSYIGLEELGGASIIPGKPYVLLMKNGDLHFRMIRTNQDHAQHLLRPINKQDYDDMSVLKKDVDKVYKARGPITIKDEYY